MDCSSTAIAKTTIHHRRRQAHLLHQLVLGGDGSTQYWKSLQSLAILHNV